MEEKRKEFFSKLSKLCSEYDAAITGTAGGYVFFHIGSFVEEGEVFKGGKVQLLTERFFDGEEVMR